MTHHHIDYVEFPAADLAAQEHFFRAVFGWEFTAYGPDYSAFAASGIAGGFYRAPLTSQTSAGAALVVIYSQSLEATQMAVQNQGGRIVTDVFSFPGGRRFHFADPCGNEWAVWSDRLAEG
jgi:uncharacterized protein